MTPDVDIALRDLSAALRGTEWDGRLWLVGGAVRDQLLGVATSTPDIDLVLEGNAPFWLMFGTAKDKSVAVNSKFKRMFELVAAVVCCMLTVTRYEVKF
jgi:tRNA nucleotidyltransferase/poly(A) polymerase